MDLKKLAYNNISRNFNAYLGYFLSCVISIMIFFGFSVCLFHPLITGAGISNNSAMGSALLIASIVIALFSLLFIIYSLGTFIKSRFREFGTLLILGMSDKQLKKLVFLESLFIGVLSIICALVFGLIFSKPFLLIVSKSFSINSLTMYFPIKSIVVTTIVFTLLFTISIPFVMITIKNKNIIELINGSKKPKNEPKTSILLSILTAILLGIGYVVSFLDINSGNLTYIIVACIILGTYFFFPQTLVWVLKKLKNNKNLYMNRTNLLWISNLVYKIKDNSRLLFLITTLLSITLVAIATLSSLVSIQLDEQRAAYPFVINYQSAEGNPQEKDRLELIEKTLNEDGFIYDKTVFNSLRIKDNGGYLISQSEFDQVGQKLNLDNVSVTDDEVVIVPRYTDSSYRNSLNELKTLQIGKNNLKVTGLASGKIFPAGYKTYIVSDYLFKKLSNNPEYEKITSFGYNFNGWEKSIEEGYNFNEHIKNTSKNNFEKGILKETYTDLRYYYKISIDVTNTMNFMGIFMSIVFFIGSCSFLYFRFYTDLIYDKEKYKNLSKLGLSYKELKKILTIEISSMFYIPYMVAFFNATISIIIFSKVKGFSLGLKGLSTSCIILVIYSIYFVILKNKYIKEIAKIIPGYLD